jgi:hypothetical protein
MGEVDPPDSRQGFLQARRRNPMQGLAGRDECPLLRRILDGPGFATVATPREQMFLRFLAINVVPLTQVL